MAWLKLYDTFREHSKVTRLADELDIRDAEARGLVTGLWAWCLTNAYSGDLGDMTPREIERAADWEGERGAFFSAAVRLGLIDEVDGGHAVHGYARRGGSYVENRKRNERRQREREEAEKQEVTSVSADNPRRVPGLSAKCPGLEEKRREEKRVEEKRIHTLAKVKVNGPNKQLVDDGRAVLARYREKFPNLPQPVEGDPNHRRVIDRLKEPNITLGICLLAIEGNAGDEFYQGRGLHSIKDIFKDNDKVIELATKAMHQRDGPKLPDGKLKRNLSEGDEWLIAEENAR